MRRPFTRGAAGQPGRRVAAAGAAAFGLATIVSGGRVLFGGGGAAAGDYVPFVVAFNFAAGFAYVAAALGLAAGRRWSAALAAVIAVVTVLVFAAFGVHVATGGQYEPRTVAALTLRSGFWLALAALARRWIRARGRSPGPPSGDTGRPRVS